MSCRKRSLVLFFLILCLTLFSSSPFSAEAGSPVGITILHVNDTHGHIQPAVEKSVDPERPVGGAAWLARMIESEREDNPEGTLLLSGGDMFQGTAISNIFRGKPVMEVMNAVKFDAMVIGNHEFDWGRKVLNRLRKAARFPFLSANIKDRKGNDLPGVRPYVILERRGLKIAVIGMTTTETGDMTKPNHVTGLRFLEPEDVLPDEIRQAKSRGAKMIIVLSHLGLDADKKMAVDIPGVDLIVGGHSHTAVDPPVVIGKTLIVQAGCYGWYLGVLRLKVDSESGGIIQHSKKTELKKVFSGPDDPFDPKISRIVKQYHDQIKDRFAVAIGETTVDLVRNSRAESNIGDLVCDAMREAERTDIAFHNSGGIRANLPAGKITLEQIYAVLPFDNVLVSMDLTGKQILRLLEQNASLEYGILQVSGLKVRYDLSKPLGERVVEAAAGGSPILPAKFYRVVTNDFLAAGGDKFAVFGEGTNVRYGDTLRDVFARYVKKHSPLQPEIEGRIVLSNERTLIRLCGRQPGYDLSRHESETRSGRARSKPPESRAGGPHDRCGW
jgi:5'-nucleotidase/UDP-sugar diphosphatase